MDTTTGRAKIDWAMTHMPLLAKLKEEFLATKPFDGKRIAMSIHLEAKTACLAILLRDGGANVWITGSNPLSTQDDVAAALAEEEGISVHARHGVSSEEYTTHLREVLAPDPHLILDDGGDLVDLLHEGGPSSVIGGCEETTTGVARLRIRAKEGNLRFPMFAVNDAQMKYLFDNRYGTGQSVWDAITRSTNLLVAGNTVVVGGYGWCGRGVALRARGLGAHVIVTEVDPVKAIEAVMDGFDVAPMTEAIQAADFLITVTGCIDVVTAEALKQAKDGLILANAGHFNVEINLDDLSALAQQTSPARDGVVQFTLEDGRRINLLAEGRLVNLALGDGHPVEIMDISFALQALTLAHLASETTLVPGLYAVPGEIDVRVAQMKLEALGLGIDRLSEAQRAYLGLDPA